MIDYSKLKKVPYGGDYNPEQWPEETWDEDMRLMKLAGIDIVTLNVFSWAAIQPDEETYDFSKLDKIVNLVKKNGMNICMATSTGAHPAWMARKYPDILRVEAGGMKRKFGGRQNSCPSSVTYRRFAPALAGKLAEHYKDEKSIVAWHISNEFSGDCYCDNCEKKFRAWLKDRYKTIDNLNKAWNTAFWGHTFYEWDEIVIPDERSEHWGDNRTVFQGISIDYRRFMSDIILDCYKLERDVIKSVIPDASVTTNLMGFYKPLDYFKWAKEMDFVSWDNYPSVNDSYAQISMAHDLMRGIGQGAPFALMEQTPSVTNWQPYNALKRPGVMRLWSYQAMAHGSDTVMFFQMKRSIGACEKYHGAVIDHACHENTRVFREVAELGAELENVGNNLFGTETKSDVGIIWDWDNWWAMEYSAGPSCDLKYVNEFGKFYRALRQMNYNVDIISFDSDFSKYKLIIAPVLYMVRTGEDEIIREYVRNGGSFMTTFFSGYVQENDLVITGGYPGRLRDILGIWVEEEDAYPQDKCNYFGYNGEEYPANMLCDLMHLEGAEPMDDNGYRDDFYKGMPVITVNNFGEGRAYYVGTSSTDEFYLDYLSDVCGLEGIEPVAECEDNVEFTTRENADFRYYFILNHSAEDKTINFNHAGKNIITNEDVIAGDIILKGRDVMIIKTEI
ncbi:MAG: beta-galactosidase [Coprococcus sp.]